MRPSTRPESVGSQRGRRIAIILAILLLVGLPLYLWPLRGGIEGLPGAAGLSGAPPDPRSAKALAQLPTDVWDGLMGHHSTPSGSSAGGPKGSGNLTRIHPHEEGNGEGPLGFGTVGSFAPRFDPGSMPPVTALLSEAGAGSGGSSSSGGPSGDSSPGLASGTSSPAGGSGGQGGGWSPFAGGGGPFGGGGSGGGDGFTPPGLVAVPGPDDPPMPTPEPGTLLLVGFNLAVVGATAWRRLNRPQECKPSG